MNPRRPRSWQARTRSQETLLGLLQSYPNLHLVEWVSSCGYDFLVLDAEHGVLKEEDFQEALEALAATDVLALVRLADHDTQALTRYVDMGADAIVAPHVSTAAEARVLARAMPSPKRASLIVLIESALGVRNAEEILAVPGIEGVFVGPGDLTADLGCPGDYAHCAYAQALAHLERTASASGIVFGAAVHGAYSVEALRARGHRLVLLGSDRSLLREALRARMIQARSNADAQS